uniref:Uncharacterized protein n=1 Tax=Arundo donax TaxID=35708 RepID=A0A0A8YDM5_ARUDO
MLPRTSMGISLVRSGPTSSSAPPPPPPGGSSWPWIPSSFILLSLASSPMAAPPHKCRK